MEPSAILYLIIGISSVTYVFSQALEYLNLKAERKDLPETIAAFYDRDKYLRSLDYHRDQTNFGFITAGFNITISLLMLVFGGFGMLDTFLRPYFNNEIILALVFFGILILTSDILTLPFQWHSTFVIEEKYGFNKTTVRTFVNDKLKGYVLGAVIGGILISVLIYLIQSIGPNFWIWFGLVIAAFILFVNMFYTSLILPLFNKLTPLPDGELKTAIQTFATKINFPLDNIFVMDGSKRSKKANAFFSGIGRKKKIVLYDTLVSNHTTEELVAVLAHEAGHFKKKHIIWNYLLSVVQIFLMLFILSKMVFNINLSLALGGYQQAIHLNLLAFGILYSPISGITGLLMSLYSRKNEYEADAFAKENFNGSSMATALKKLSVDSLSNLYPHPAYVFFHYSHPPLLKRLEALQGKL
jgi:STE24 endopeptidase